MNRLDKELRDYKARESDLMIMRAQLQGMEQRHTEKTVESFGIAPGRTASVESMIEAIKKVTALQKKRYISKGTR